MNQCTVADAIPTHTWCAAPWLQIYIDQTGNVSPCCVFRGMSGDMSKVRGVSGIDAFQDISVSWNSDVIRQVRIEMLAGRMPKTCHVCFHTEDAGVPSLRQFFNSEWRDHIETAVLTTGPDGSVLPAIIREMGIQFSNRCNLKCRMCSPNNSRAILTDYARLHGLSKNDESLRQYKGNDWMASPEFQQAFAKNTATVTKLVFTGGEPLLRKEMLKMMQGLVERGKAAEMTLLYVTNLTVWPAHLFEVWKKFKVVWITVSLDGMGPLVEYIRHPLKWTVLESNMKVLDAMAKDHNLRLHVSITVQAYNVLALDQIITYVATELPNFGSPYIDLLNSPAPLAIWVLPPALKEVAVQRLEQLIDRLMNGLASHWSLAEQRVMIKTVEGLITSLRRIERDDLLPEFRRWTEVLDKSRGEDIRVAIPELSTLFIGPEGQA